MSKNKNLSYTDRNRQIEEIQAKQQILTEKQIPTEKQMKYYASLLSQCSEKGIIISLDKPYTRSGYSKNIRLLEKALNNNQQGVDKLLALFAEMNNSQKIRLIAYAEGMLGKEASDNKAVTLPSKKSS